MNQELLNNFIGQEKIIGNLKLYVELLKRKKIENKNILFYGPSGMGKTTLANFYANSLNMKIKILQGPLLKKPSDIISVLIDLQEGEILFIDEIHSISRNVEEILYSLLDFKKVSIIINKEFSNNIIDLKIPHFNLIGATTEISKLTKPFISRFDYQANIEDYTKEECRKIVVEFFITNDIKIIDQEIKLILNYINYNPRSVKNFLTKISEVYLITNNIKEAIDKSIILLGIHKYGLNKWQYDYLEFLSSINSSQGYKTICNYLNVDENYLLKQLEPYLLKMNLINKGSKGRRITDKGISYLKGQER